MQQYIAFKYLDLGEGVFEIQTSNTEILSFQVDKELGCVVGLSGDGPQCKFKKVTS
jgi:hypothetical protein